MIDPTATHPFEYKLLKAATRISTRLTGRHQAYVIILDGDGAVKRLLFERREDTWFEVVDSLRAEGIAHVFYQPSTPSERVWMSWLNISHDVLVRLFDLDLTSLDFEPVDAAERSDALTSIPETWEVMFEVNAATQRCSSAED